MTKNDLPEAVLVALEQLEGSGTVAQVAEKIWRNREEDLRAAGQLFYTWQYDMRWAAQWLKREGKLVYATDAGRSVWQRR